MVCSHCPTPTVTVLCSIAITCRTVHIRPSPTPLPTPMGSIVKFLFSRDATTKIGVFLLDVGCYFSQYFIKLMHRHSVIEKEPISKVPLITVQIEELAFASTILIKRVYPDFSGYVIQLEEYIKQ